MTRKRFCKLWIAYITRLNEWAKTNGSEPMDMGMVYRCAAKVRRSGGELGMSYQEWWNRMKELDTDLFDVGGM